MNPRDKALIQVLWESGTRIGELLTLLVKDVEPMNNGDALKLHLHESKTEVRSIAIVKSAPALINWMESHSKRDNKNAPLWCNLTKNNSPMTYNGVKKILRYLKRRSGLDKPINPHNFRKSSASYWSRYLSDQEMKKRFGWTPDSKQLQTYCHLDEEKINEKILKLEGVIEATSDDERQEDENLKPQLCKWCNRLNPAGQEYCVLCKRPLNEIENLLQSQVIENVDSGIREFTEQNPELINQFIEFMREKAVSV